MESDSGSRSSKKRKRDDEVQDVSTFFPATVTAIDLTRSTGKIMPTPNYFQPNVLASLAKFFNGLVKNSPGNTSSTGPTGVIQLLHLESVLHTINILKETESKDEGMRILVANRWPDMLIV